MSVRFRMSHTYRHHGDAANAGVETLTIAEMYFHYGLRHFIVNIEYRPHAVSYER